jgi:hypothetical protein
VTGTLFSGLDLRSSNDGWAAGSGGAVRRWQGAGWIDTASGVTSTLRAVHAISSTLALIAGDDGTALLANGVTFTDVFSGSSPGIRSLSLLSPTFGFAGGSDGAVYRWDGASFGAAEPITTVAIRDLAIVSPTLGFAVTGDGDNRIYQWNGASWTPVYTATVSLNGLSIAGDTGFAVGDGGAIVRWSSGAWSAFSTPVVADLAAVSLSSPAEGWAVGAGGLILRFSGGSWAIHAHSATTHDLFAVDALSNAEAFAAGDGVILRYGAP